MIGVFMVAQATPTDGMTNEQVVKAVIYGERVKTLRRKNFVGKDPLASYDVNVTDVNDLVVFNLLLLLTGASFGLLAGILGNIIAGGSGAIFFALFAFVAIVGAVYGWGAFKNGLKNFEADIKTLQIMDPQGAYLYKRYHEEAAPKPLTREEKILRKLESGKHDVSDLREKAIKKNLKG